MPRPVKGRRVGFIPEANFFKPAGIPMRELEEISLSLEELEAVRLKDQQGFLQEECARLMHISRPTFHRVLGSARGKIADALTNGKAIRIEGGNFEVARHRFRCGHDGHEWDVPSRDIQAGRVRFCPKCRGGDIKPIYSISQIASGRGGGHHRGRLWK